MIVQPKPYSPQDAIELIGCNPTQANFNQIAGPANSFFSEDGKLLACGGAREFGAAEVWLMVAPEVKGGMKKTLLETTAFVIDKYIRENRYWKLYADSENNGNFLKHVGFKPIQTFVWEAT